MGSINFPIFQLNKPCRLPDSGLPVIQCGSGIMDYEMDPFNKQQLATGELKQKQMPNIVNCRLKQLLVRNDYIHNNIFIIFLGTV